MDFWKDNVTYIMEFHEKLQELRRGRGLTQEELAEAIFVSRTAISKWESGRGYPSIDSLKALAKFFSVTVDELLSPDEVLTIAEEDRDRAQEQTRQKMGDALFALADVCMLLLLFLPLFAGRVGRADGGVQAVSLLALTDMPVYLKASYLAIIGGSALWGILTLALQNCHRAGWMRVKRPVSLALHGAGVLLFILGAHPYAAVFSLALLAMKLGICFKPA